MVGAGAVPPHRNAGMRPLFVVLLAEASAQPPITFVPLESTGEMRPNTLPSGSRR